MLHAARSGRRQVFVLGGDSGELLQLRAECVLRNHVHGYAQSWRASGGAGFRSGLPMRIPMNTAGFFHTLVPTPGTPVYIRR